LGDLAPALATQAKLHVLGFAPDQLQVFKRDSDAWEPNPEKQPQAGSNAALKDMVVDGAIGGAVGMGLGALAEVALLAVNVSLSIAAHCWHHRRHGGRREKGSTTICIDPRCGGKWSIRIGGGDSDGPAGCLGAGNRAGRRW